MRRIFLYFYLVISLLACNHHDNNKQVEISRNDVPIAYDRCGNGDTTLLFVHGWCINKEYWQPQEKYFCPRYTVVTIDLPGFGASGTNRQDWTFDEYTEDVKSVIQQLQLQHVILIGHSMSGDILLNISNKYPQLVAGIVGIDNLHEPGHVLTNDEKKQTDDFFAMLENHFDSTASKYMKETLFQPSTDTAIVQRVMNNIFTSDSSIATKVLRSLTAISQNEKPLMENLAHRLYLVNSDVYPVNADSLSKYCKKGFHVELVHGTGHYPMIEAPAEFNEALQKVIYKIGNRE